MSPDPASSCRKSTWGFDAALLTLVCAVLYLPGLWAVGLSTWHEAQRAMVTREMYRAGEWIVPLINGHPYLAKPPLFYWCQLGMAQVLGGPPDERAARLTAAVWAWLGVLATYFVGRRFAREGLVGGFTGDVAGRAHPDHTGRVPGVLAALFLATGPMYLHHARVGEIDILLPALVTLGIGGLSLAWTKSLSPEGLGAMPRSRWGWIGLGVLAMALAGLAKGPPALGVIAVGAIGGMVWWSACERAPRHAARDATAVVLGALATLPFVAGELTSVKAVVGAVVGAAYAALACWLLARVISSRAVWSGVGAALRRSQGVLAFVLALVPFAAWLLWATARVGGDEAARWSEGEAESNFRWLDASVPYGNLEVGLWAVGLGSVLCAIALLWCVWRRPRVRPSGYVLLAWLCLGLMIFSLFGKGFPRYLLPMWPAVAIIAGVFAGQVLARARQPATRVALTAIISSLVIGESVWFAWLHPRLNADKSPRDLVAELLSPAHGVKPEELTVFQFWTAAVDYYAGARPIIVGDVLEKDQNVGSTPLTEQEFADDLRRTGRSRVVLVREGDRPDRIARGKAVPGPVRLRNLGLSVEPISTTAGYRFDGGRSRVIAVRVRWAGPP